MYSVIIIGGGLAGLTSSIELARRGIRVLLIERKAYPHHKVCGEYVSNEVRPYLEALGLNLNKLGASDISRFQFTSPKGSTLESPLGMGGFGISRFRLDDALYHLALDALVEFQLNTTVMEVNWKENHFEIITSNNETVKAQIVIGAFGKRTRLDKLMNRSFMSAKSPYVGVKYHIRGNFPRDLIALHNFNNGYCGLSSIEDDKFCLCYLTSKANIKTAGSIPDMEQRIMSKNPFLRTILNEAEFLYDKPEVINEVSFDKKSCVENHILMAGDSAGLITPLCGNGMAMAIRAGSMLARQIKAFYDDHGSHQLLEERYIIEWQAEFARRLQVGRLVQRVFGHEIISEFALSFFSVAPHLLKYVIKNTHGQPMIL